jgi:polar amino acid transport system substrate-binding protein
MVIAPIQRPPVVAAAGRGASTGVARVAVWLAAIMICLQSATAANAQAEPRQPVTVGLYVSPPFVTEADGRYGGMATDLWEQIADRLGLEFTYAPYPNLRTLIDATAKGDVDVAVTNLTITQGRAQRIDFTQPWFGAGLRIMVNDEQQAGFWAIIAGLRDSGHLRAYTWLAIVVLLATMLLTLFDRRFDSNFPRRWRDGLAESFYTVMSVATSGKPPSRKNLFGWIGRIWQGLWMVCGIAVLAYVTSSVTSVMTTLALANQINSLADLPGKTVGVFSGSVAEEFAGETGLASRAFSGIDDTVAALKDGRVTAIIGDAPVLEYYAHTHPEAAVSVVGAILEPDKYGFGVGLHSPLTRELTVELLGVREDGIVEQLRSRYFGEAP